MTQRPWALLAALFIALGAALQETHAADAWQAGVARVKITPERPIVLQGYFGRVTPTNQKLHDLWAKALVLQDAEGHKLALVTMDLAGIERKLSLAARNRIEKKYGIPLANMALATSHTHTGPVVLDCAPAADKHPPEQQALIEEYAVTLADNLVQVVGDALANMRPAELSFGTGTCTFAVNRRNNPEAQVSELITANKLAGPVDHDAPVLKVANPDGTLRAIVFGYACHATVLNDVILSGDWPGFTQIELESRQPEAVALFWAGCGADQNPLPRRSVELAKKYGRQMADAVDAVLSKPMKSISPQLRTAYIEIDLPLADLPTRDALEREAAANDPAGLRAQRLLAAWDRDGRLMSTRPYPVQIWRLGTDLEWILLGGEVVVDYSLRLKQSSTANTTWVASYANDVLAYIPSRRVLLEGGYEGRESMVYFALPGHWDVSVEERIVNACDTLRQRFSTVKDASATD